MRRYAPLPLPLVALALAACGADATGDPAPAAPPASLLAAYADSVVVPTYELLAARAATLASSAAALAASPDDERLDATRAAWVAARVAWEQSEGFLYGPVDTFGYDPAMDSWPVNRTDLDAVLASSEALTPAYVGSLAPELRGFHTIEYLIFGVDRSRTAADLDARTLEYLLALTSDFSSVASGLATSWTVAGADLPAYRDVLATAGEPGNNAYPSASAGFQELVNGMSLILDEVANGKIAEPFDNRDPELVESQFSFNSLADFTDNVRSVQNTWTGDCPECGTSGPGLDEWVAQQDAALHATIESQLAAAIQAIGAIPAPFRDAIQDPDADDAILTAQDALRALDHTVRSALLPLVVP